jgi:trans-aconitate methyltransferase
MSPRSHSLKPRGSIAGFPGALARELDDTRRVFARAEKGGFVPLADTWDAELFLRFEAARARPARDLVARIESSPQVAVDLGCGPWSSTRLLAERFPDARVVGIDSSARMLAEARRRLPGVAFEQVDIARWRPERRPDLIFANGALEWVPDHQTLFPRLMAQLAAGGTLAVQMPDTTQEPTHALMRLIAADGPWSDRLVPIAKTRAVIAPYTDYYNWLRPHLADDLRPSAREHRCRSRLVSRLGAASVPRAAYPRRAGRVSGSLSPRTGRVLWRRERRAHAIPLSRPVHPGAEGPGAVTRSPHFPRLSRLGMIGNQVDRDDG